MISDMATRIQHELDGVDLVAHCIAASPEGLTACMNPIVTNLTPSHSQFAALLLPITSAGIRSSLYCCSDHYTLLAAKYKDC